MNGMFEQATRHELRWNYRGNLSVEDLWYLGVKELDEIYKSLNRQVKESSEESLLTESEVNKELELQIAIVKRIVEVRLAEQQAQEQATIKAARKQRLFAILADKQDEELRGMTTEEIQAEIDAL